MWALSRPPLLMLLSVVPEGTASSRGDQIATGTRVRTACSGQQRQPRQKALQRAAAGAAVRKDGDAAVARSLRPGTVSPASTCHRPDRAFAPHVALKSAIP